MAITINGTGTLTGVSVGGLPDGIVDRDTLATQAKGSILQVVQTYYTTHFSSTSTSYVDIGLSATITPSSSSNKILITTDLSAGCTNTTSLYFRLYNGSSEITAATNSNGSGDQAAAFLAAINHPSGAQYDIDQISHHYLYSPSTTSATTIKVYGRTDDYTFYINRYGYSSSVGGASSLTLMEVVG